MELDRSSNLALPREVEGILARVEGDVPQPLHVVPRATLDREERMIKQTLLRMASLIEERIRLTVEALETHDAALALTVIEGDAEINALQAEALDSIVRTIATQAPVAHDLRFLLTLDHVADELERIGDSIANSRSAFGTWPPTPRSPSTSGSRRWGALPPGSSPTSGRLSWIPTSERHARSRARTMRSTRITIGPWMS